MTILKKQPKLLNDVLEILKQPSHETLQGFIQETDRDKNFWQQILASVSLAPSI